MEKVKDNIDARMDRFLEMIEKSSLEFDKKLEKSRIEADAAAEKRKAEYDAAAEKRKTEYEEKLAKERVEYDAKLAKERAEHDAKLAKEKAEFEEKRLKEKADFDERMKKLEKQIGGIGNNNGLIAEEYFFNSFEKGKKNFFGENFDDIRKNIKGLKIDDEYDILLINGQSIGIVEIKYKAHENDIPKILKKAETFRENFADYKNKKVYLGLATMAFYPDLEDECIKNGIAIVKQVGDTVVIYDEHLKKY